MYNIETLVKISGISKRTIRYYIEKKLLSPPLGSCRGSYYDETHLDRLEKIKKMASQGVPLEKMREFLYSVVVTESVEKTELWERLVLFDGLEVNFRKNLLNEEQIKKIKVLLKSFFN